MSTIDEALEVELLALVVKHTNVLFRPLLALVNRKWSDAVQFYMCVMVGTRARSDDEAVSRLRQKREAVLSKRRDKHCYHPGAAYVPRPSKKRLLALGKPAEPHSDWVHGTTSNGRMIYHGYRVWLAQRPKRERCCWAHGNDATACSVRYVNRLVKGGHFGLVRYFHERGAMLPSCTDQAASRHGHVHVLEWMCSQGLIDLRKDVLRVVRIAAAAAGASRIDVLKWLNREGYLTSQRLERSIYERAAMHGRSDAIEWLVDTFGSDARTSKGERCLGFHLLCAAGKSGDRIFFDSIYERACVAKGRDPLALDLSDSAANSLGYASANAAKRNHLELIEHIHERWDIVPGGENTGEYVECLVTKAAERGHLDALKWLYAHEYPFYFVWSSAAYGGCIEMLQWLVNKDVDSERNEAWMGAAHKGDVRILEWLMANGWVWNAGAATSVSMWAASVGHIAVLEWFESRGFEWNRAAVAERARKEGQIEVAEWIEALIRSL